MLNPKCLCKLAKTKVDLLICTNLCRVLKNKTQHKHNRARAAVQRTIFLLKFALFSKPFLKKVRASDDCKLSLDPGCRYDFLVNIFQFRNTSLDDAMSNSSSELLPPPPTKLQKEFTSYLSIASNVPNAVFVILHALLGHLVGMRIRVLGSQVRNRKFVGKKLSRRLLELLHTLHSLF